jgi:hypothetical protein
MGEPAPADLRELANRVEQLAADIVAAHAALRSAADRPTRRLGYTFDDDAGSLRRIARDVAETARELEHVLGRNAPGRRPCVVESGGCPEHGGTLSTATRVGRWRCTTPGCGRTWDWDIGALPCLEPAAFTVLDGDGSAMELCVGHTVDARRHLVGARVVSLRPVEEGSR